MSSTATRPLSLKGLYDVIQVISPDMPDYSGDIMRTITTTALAEEMAWVSSLTPPIRLNELDGMPVQVVSVPYTKTFENVLYGTGVRYTKRQVRTDQTGVLKQVGRLLREAFYVHKQTLGADIINNSTVAGNTGIDGVVLQSASHPTSTPGVVWSNITTAVSGVSITTFEQMLDDIRANHKTYTAAQPWQWRGRYNLIAGIGCSELAIKRILAGMEQPGTSDREVNVARNYINFNGCNPFVTGTQLAMIPVGDANPIFYMLGKDMEIREDMETGKGQAGHPHTYFMEVDHTTGWKMAQGVQFASGS